MFKPVISCLFLKTIRLNLRVLKISKRKTAHHGFIQSTKLHVVWSKNSSLVALNKRRLLGNEPQSILKKQQEEHLLNRFLNVKPLTESRKYLQHQ